MQMDFVGLGLIPKVNDRLEVRLYSFYLSEEERLLELMSGCCFQVSVLSPLHKNYKNENKYKYKYKNKNKNKNTSWKK